MGVPAYDALVSAMFSMHGYFILGGGDIPALSMLLKMKEHNAFCPCRMCKILDVLIPSGAASVYYIPLDRSTHPTVLNDPSNIAVYDPLDLPLRSHEEFMA